MLVVIPLKTTKRLDLRESLSKWMDTSHPQYNSSDCQSDLQRLESIRADIADMLTVSDTGHSLVLPQGLRDLMEYHACLVECQDRGFPTSARDAMVNGTVDAKIEFWWKNAFEAWDGHDDDCLSEPTKSHFHYERACVLWNIAAMYTYTATTEDFESKQGRSKIHKSYELAATIFQYIQTVLLQSTSQSKNKHAASITSDLIPASISMCKYLCLAQGQVCAYIALKERLTEESKNGNGTIATQTLLAKIAMGCADLYDQALTYSQDSSLKAQLPNMTKSWGKHIKLCSMLFHSRAEYLSSRVAYRESKYGLEIARLKQCIEKCEEAVKFSRQSGKTIQVYGPQSLSTPVSSVLQLLLDSTKQRKITAEKENKDIYMDRIPKTKSLPPVEGSSVMKQCSDEDEITLPEEFHQLDRPIFISLPPLYRD